MDRRVTPADAAYVVTLVHGTWADTQGWVAPGSFLRRRIEAGLPGVVFRAFGWTGANTHAARTEAGERLAQFIRDGHAQRPDARHYVVAHSHGGNVAMYAMRDPAARAVIAGIVTLATPFISTRRRAFRRHVTPAAALAVALATMVLAFGVFDTLREPVLAVVATLAALLLIDRLVPVLSKRVIDVARRTQARTVAALQLPRVDPSQLLILSTRGDEASRWLRGWDMVAQTPFVIAGAILSLVGAVSQSKIYGNLRDVSVFGIEGWTLAAGLIGAAAVAGVGLVFSGVMNWPGYWRESLRANLLVDIRTAPVPETAGFGCHHAYSFEVTRQLARIDRGFRHTAICDNTAVASATIAWISSGSRPGQ